MDNVTNDITNINSIFFFKLVMLFILQKAIFTPKRENRN